MPHVDIDGVELEARLIPGDAERPWLVLLHEGLGCVSLWRDFPDKLARRTGCPALIYSRRGYGRSAPLAGPREPDFMHREAHDVLPPLLAHFEIEQPVLVGHSDGASIALIHAAANPTTVRAVVLMAPHVLVEPISINAIERMAATYAVTDLKGRLARHHAHVDDAFLGWSGIWRDPRFRSWSLAAECRSLAVPSLLIQGDADAYGTLAQIDTIATLAAGRTERLVLAGCGHAPHREREAEVLAAIAAFVTAN